MKKISVLFIVLTIYITNCSIITKSQNRSKRRIKNYTLTLKNSDFEAYSESNNFTIPNWEFEIQNNSRIEISDGYKSKTSISLVSNDIDESSNNIFTMVQIPDDIYLGANVYYSVSAWVWADTPIAALLRLESDTGKTSVSAYHSGNGKWEYLTVVYPFYEDMTKNFKLRFINKNGIAKLDKVIALALSDDRFQDIGDIREGQFREKVNYRKTNRIRVAVVGNSTIIGIGAAKNATISYILQQKLESLYPGSFEVINFGISAWSLKSQIITAEDVFFFTPWNSSVILPEEINNYKRYAKTENEVTLKSILPDIVIISSMWNDLSSTLHAQVEHINKTPYPLEWNGIGEIPFSVIYYNSLYNYMENPSKEKYNYTKQLYSNIFKSIDKKKYTIENNYALLKKSKQFKIYISYARFNYNFLLRKLVIKALKWSDVYLCSLPFKGGDNYLKYIKKIPEHMEHTGYVSSNETDRLKIFYYKYHEMSKIHCEVENEISKEYSLKYINLNKLYQDQHSKLPPVIFSNLDYFVADPVHFTYRGNEWLADKLFMSLNSEFERLANNKKK